jgi:hypothetical protein
VDSTSSNDLVILRMIFVRWNLLLNMQGLVSDSHPPSLRASVCEQKKSHTLSHTCNGRSNPETSE